MKYRVLISALAVAATLGACGKTDEPVNLVVTNWGPQATPAGVIAGKQPDGSMGIWIQVAKTKGLGEAQVLFAGQPAKSTVVADKLITAAIAPEQLAAPGDKEVAVKQVTSNKTFPVGIFKVTEK